MRTGSLSFNNGVLLIGKGIKAKREGDAPSVQLFEHQERVLSLPVDLEHPPLVMVAEGCTEPGVVHLAFLSLVGDEKGGVCATSEVDTHYGVLLLIDTYDDALPEESSGEYTLPDGHDKRLPRTFVPTKFGPAHVGLVPFIPGDSSVIRSSSGHLAKLKLDIHGNFFLIPCDPGDRALMDGRS